MTRPLLLATRTMRARGLSRCSMCNSGIQVRQRIGLVIGWGWCHVECIVAASRKPPPAVTVDDIADQAQQIQQQVDQLAGEFGEAIDRLGESQVTACERDIEGM